jgi:hypothetical protein
MNRRPIIPVRSFKTDVYGTSLAIGPKMRPVDRTEPSPGVENPITKLTRLREEQQLRDFQREQREQAERREQYEQAKRDRRAFDSIMETIETGNTERFKIEFSRARYEVKMRQREGRYIDYEDYEEYEEDEEAGGADNEIEQTLLTHAFVYDNPEIFQILLVNQIDNGLDFVKRVIKKMKTYLSEKGKTMKMMLKDYNTYVKFSYPINNYEEEQKKNAFRRLQRRNPETGKISRKVDVVTTEEWNAEKGMGAL